MDPLCPNFSKPPLSLLSFCFSFTSSRHIPLWLSVSYFYFFCKLSYDPFPLRCCSKLDACCPVECHAFALLSLLSLLTPFLSSLLFRLSLSITPFLSDLSRFFLPRNPHFSLAFPSLSITPFFSLGLAFKIYVVNLDLCNNLHPLRLLSLFLLKGGVQDLCCQRRSLQQPAPIEMLFKVRCLPCC